MLTTIHFYNQLSRPANEVDDISIDRKLPEKLDILQSAISQAQPKLLFGICW